MDHQKRTLPPPVIDKHYVVFGPTCMKLRSYNLRIMEYGTVSTRTSNPHGERFTHRYRLNYILEGHPYYIHQGEKIDLEPGCLLFLEPNTSVCLEEDRENVRMIFINFELGAIDLRKEFHEWMEHLFPYHHIHDEDGEMEKILTEILDNRNCVVPCCGLEKQNLFENLFIHLLRKSTQYPEEHPKLPMNGSEQILQNAMNWINGNIQRNFRISEMAEALNVSNNYLYKIFMKEKGVPTSSFILNYRMELAKSYLETGNLPVKVIAASLGYENASHFSELFKQKNGMSPNEYRKAKQSS